MVKFAFQVLLMLAMFLLFMFVLSIVEPILTHPIVFSIWFGFLILVVIKLLKRWINE